MEWEEIKESKDVREQGHGEGVGGRLKSKTHSVLVWGKSPFVEKSIVSLCSYNREQKENRVQKQNARAIIDSEIPYSSGVSKFHTFQGLIHMEGHGAACIYRIDSFYKSL